MKKIISIILSLSLIMVMVSYAGAETSETSGTLKEGVEETVTVSDVDTSVRFVFTPETDGRYSISSSGSIDAYVELYDSEGNCMDFSDDDKDADFEISCELNAGNTYFIDCYSYMEDDSYTVIVEKVKKLVSAEILSLPYQTEYIQNAEGFVWTEGLVIKGIFEDSTEATWEYGTSTYFEGHYVGIETSVDMLEIGTKSIAVNIDDISLEFEIEVVEHNVEKIEVLESSVPSLIENLDGYMDEEEELFIYNTYFVEDLVFLVTYKDGSTEELTIFDEIDGYCITEVGYGEFNQYTAPWTKGGENILEFQYGDVNTFISVPIVENPVSSIEMTKIPDRTYIWGDTYFGYYYEGYHFVCPEVDSMELTVNFKDGSSKVYNGGEIQYGDMDGYYLQFGEIEDVPESGGSFTMKAHYMNHSCEIPITIVESHVKSIELVKEPLVAEYENEFFPDYLGAEIKVLYKDGTQELVKVTEENYRRDSYSIQVSEVETARGDFIELFDYVDEEDDEERGLTIYLYGAIDTYTGIKYVDNLKIEDILLENVSLEPENLKVTISYDDGSQEFIDGVTEYFVYDYFCQAVVKSEKGYFYVYIFNEFDGVYYVDVFGEVLSIQKEGDITADGVINAEDALAVLKHAARIETLYDSAEIAADVNADRIINADDALDILKFAAKIINEL